MTFIESLKDRCHSLLTSGALDQALATWKTTSPAFSAFVDVGQIVELLTNTGSQLKHEKDLALRALCEIAREGDEEASLLLIWLFAGVFLRTRLEIGSCRLSEEELEAEMLAGFWDEIARAQGPEENVATRLFYAIQNRAWKAVRWANRGGLPIDDPDEEVIVSARTFDLPDPIELVERALGQGAISQKEADLILSTRVHGRSLELLANAAGVSPRAVAMRRRRAERKFMSWLANLEEIQALSVADSA